MRTSWLLSTAITFCLGGSAFAAGPRLGHFEGTAKSTSLVRVTGQQGQIIRSAGSPEKVQLKLRKDTGRLYISKGADAGSPAWRQSFQVKSDHVAPDGTRVIEYARPQAGSRSASHNLRALNATIPGQPLRMVHMEGGGMVEISRNGKMRWSNVGGGDLGLAGHSGKIARSEWIEQHEGKRAR